ncbi:MAG: transcriptional repressor [Bacteroidales bacterium]|jgi:Fur family ferric uptake transcriptional regulator|nr:transcriptional repressor [Bacteroidales bacterium]
MNAIELLRSKGLKKTAQRIMLINILQKKAVTLTEDDIKQEMGDLYDRITFYRTVQTLLEADLIHRINVDNKTVKYALNETSPHTKDHSHFFCKKCRSVTCLKDVPAITYHLPDGFKGEECEIIIKGICGNCLSVT